MMALTPMHARKAQRDRDRAEGEARLLQEAPGSTLSATIAEGSATTQPEDHPLPRTPTDHSVAAGPYEVKARQVRLQDALGLTTVATDPLADRGVSRIREKNKCLRFVPGLVWIPLTYVYQWIPHAGSIEKA